MVITSEEVKIIDNNCEELGMDVLQLMENAGAATAKIVLEEFPSAKKIIICCGKGNNGGDGFVAARHLAAANRIVTLVIIGDPDDIHSQIAQQNFSVLTQMEHSVNIISLPDTSKISLLKKTLKEADLILDALLGIGISSEVYDPIKSAIKVINNSKKEIVSLDMPSGLWSDIKKTPKTFVKATRIITFHDTKPCLTLDEFKEKTIIVDIGVPPEAEIFVGKGDLKASLPKRKEDSHKGENGTVLIVGGSSKYSGAPILTSRAALRTGADLVITCIPSVIADVVRSDSPNIIVRAFEGNYFNKEHVEEVLDLAKKFDSLVIGPGIGEEEETFDFILKVISDMPKNKPIIIDADALKAIKKDLALVKDKAIIVTPHAGEFNILFDKKPPEKWIDKRKLAEEMAKQHQLVILLKGKYDIISSINDSKINRTGHEGMTTGGTGDVLAGILGEICAINNNLFRSACAAAYLAGKAGELAAEDFGNSLLATDVIEKIPEVIRDYM